jgi:DNA-binding transcriptional regulator YhcF (GntR family)
MYKVVQSSRLYEQIVQQIEDSVLKGDLKPENNCPPRENSHSSLVSVAPQFVKL